ncbi:MAG TPA: acylphosphatase [Usitatibacter sp.]|nr:acylphosphatase [Usitatibacter sp.]
MTERVTRHLAITGVVQGVWYRESMREEAERLGITGWVRNRADGSVEAVVQGSAEAVEAMQRWARRGPQQARVERVEATPAEGQFAAFEKRPTG